MVKSMTGFGRAVAELDGYVITIELKSVNHRYFEFYSRCPRQYGFIDDKIKSYVNSRVSRGKIECFVGIEALNTDAAEVAVNNTLASAYVKALKELSSTYNLKEDFGASTISRFQDVLVVKKAEEDEEKIWQLVKAVAETAVDKFIVAAKTVKYPLQEIASVGITRPELTQIASIGPVKYQKLLFTMLCYAKLYNMISETNDGWVNTDIRELYKSARVTVKYKKDKFLYLNDIESTGMISFSNKNDNLNMKVNFIDMSGKPVLNIEDFRELGYEYLYFTGQDRFIRCSECQRLIRQTGKNTRYCDSCKQKKRLEAKRNWWKNNH